MVRVKHRIGRFRVIAPIGAGGFSTVYRAIDEENGQEVAIKVLAENHSMVPDTRRRFAEEFKLRKTVESPYIAKMFEVGNTETGQPFMVLELADRGDLRKRVEEIRRSHQVLTSDDLMMLARHLTEALTALHDADIVHRDVSPGNILIRSRPSSGARQGSPERGNVTLLEPGERFLLADLGHAKDLVRSSGFTAGGGTQGFAAPEQRDDVTVVDHRADIFSATAIIEWAAHDGLFAEQLEPFCDVGLASEPEDRYPNMAEWYVAISEAVGNSDEPPRRRFRRHRPTSSVTRRPPVPAPGPVDDQPVGAPEPTTSRWSAMATATLAILLVAGLAAAGYFLSEERGDQASLEEAPVGPSTTSSPSSTSPSTSVGPLVVQPSDENEAGDEPGQRPWTAIDAPEDNTTIDGDLVISGMGTYDAGISHVEVTIRKLETTQFWNPEDGSTDSNRPWRIDVTLEDDDDPTSGRFETIVGAGELEPGDYELRIWARGTDDAAPAEPLTRLITII